MAYSLLKQLHLTTIAITLALFVLRGIWMMTASPRLHARWVRIVPHANDTLLLTSGISLAVLLQQYPLVHGWLTAKFFALILYIVLGTYALKDSDPLRAKARVESYALKDSDPLRAKARVESYALKRGKSRGQRIAAWAAALLVFGYMVSVAITHNPTPFVN
jgi:uncharacterized membrane protein SirB2